MAAPYMPFAPGDVLKGQVIGVEVSVVPAMGDVPDVLADGTNAVHHVPYGPGTSLHLALSLFSHIGIAAIGRPRALENMARGGRIAICGAVSQYGKVPEEQYRLRNVLQLLLRQSMMRGFFPAALPTLLEGANRAKLMAQVAPAVSVGRNARTVDLTDADDGGDREAWHPLGPPNRRSECQP